MAKRGTLDNPKTKRLARALGTCPGVALGLLETLWGWVGEFRRDGGLTKIDVEDALDSGGWLTLYSAEQVIGAMTDASRECIFLDALGGGRYYIHDWHEHSDDAVNRWLARRFETFANGMVPDLSRLSKDERVRIAAEFERQACARSAPEVRPDDEPQSGDKAQIEPGAQNAPNVRTPGALPVPVPVPVPVPAVDAGAPTPPAAELVPIQGGWAPFGDWLDDPRVRMGLAQIEGNRSPGIAPVSAEKVAVLVEVLRTNQAGIEDLVAVLESPSAKGWRMLDPEGVLRVWRGLRSGAQGTWNPGGNPERARKPRSQWTQAEIDVHEQELAEAEELARR